MNILLANWSWRQSGGDWTYIKSICDLYEAHGHHIVPFSMKHENNFPTPYEKYFIEKLDYIELNKNKSLKTGLKVLSKSIYSVEARKKLDMLLTDHKVDIAQLHNINNYQTPSILPIFKKHKVPVVWRVLDYKIICPNTTFVAKDKVCEDCFKHKYYNAALNRCKKGSLLASAVAAIESYTYWLLPYYKNIDLFLFQSEFTRDIFIKYGFDPKRGHMIENPYDSSSIVPVYQGKKDYIFYFGRLEQVKGVFTLLNAMRQLPNIELKVVGIGAALPDMIKFVEDNNMQNVDIIGPKWNEEMEAILKDCKFVIVPSEWYEPSPYVVLQSFAFGKAVVSTDRGGLGDLIQHNVNGLIFESANPDSLARTINELYDDSEKIVELGRNARRTLEERHDPERYYNDTINVFEKLIKHEYVYGG